MMLVCAHFVGPILDQIEQAPIVIQFPQVAPESWLKWLLPTIIQTVVSLASILAGVGIAVWSFRRNRQSEHEQWVRNQRAGHEEWIRDQKRAEWRELLDKLNAVYFPMALAKQSKQALPLEGSQKLFELSQCFSDRVFIDRSILSKFQSRLEEYALEYLGPSDNAAKEEDKSRVLEKLKALTAEVRDAAKVDLKSQN
jgi:hypothetical protein